MFVAVTESDVRLAEPEVFTAFHVVRPADMTPEGLAAALAGHDVGQLDGEDVLVRVDAVRRLAAGRVGDDWEDGFAGMLAYADRKGWLTDDGAAVRAHVEIG
ncbi:MULTISPECIES: hypothetical protein [Pseudonocardia]|uniref:Uncharacterized protein n=2 Tax=Pseudonocardia TaxID=1847 RepID=A0A1Y2MMX5_PSEAH|nr:MULTISPECIES: hypothetical protein [Pseudonocardia]OSY36349.1 hypothetical protein BG845_05426 [Pseudonocardia autotrophica]TDN72695.1 hypothetical protein C8E95_1755 [Pseudonocardia autotrophica]BBG03406.1 hypothetical protein Pdca_46150 [Pseudonocardia autotrophica]GEC27239.1 hypothetical protein PSA01_42680 [Pseudonocardia saturnea]